MTEKRKWKFSDILTLLKNIVISIFEGKLLLRLQANRYFIHIIYTYLLFMFIIWMGIKVEKTLTRVEDNRRTVADLEILRTQKEVKLESLSKISKVQMMLEESGSKLGMPTKPADRLKK